MIHSTIYPILVETLLISGAFWTSLGQLDTEQITRHSTEFYIAKLLVCLTVLTTILLKSNDHFWRTSYRKARDVGLALGSLTVPLVLSVLVMEHLSSTSSQSVTDYLMALFEISLVNGIVFLFYMMLMHSIQYALLYILLPTLLILVLSPIQQLLPYTHIMPMKWSISIPPVYLICLIILPKVFSRSFTLGELAVIVQPLLLLTMDVLLVTMGYTVDIHRPAILVFLEAATVGMIVYAVLLIPILPWNSTGKARVTSTTKIPIEYKWTNTRLMCYYVGSLIIAGLVIMPWVSMHIGQHPILWVVEFLLLDKTRLLLCAFWLACIIMAVCIFNYLDNNTSTTSTSARTNESKTEMPVIRTKAQLYLRRKFFHVLAVGMFIPGILFQPQFMHLAFSVAICAFMLTEYIRCMRIPPYGVSLHEFLIRFLDHRDQGPIILAHVYLLIGCAIPVWLQSNNTLASLAGVITLGIGDAMASTIGIRFGRHYLLGTRKTIEGTLACTIGVWTSLWLFGSSSSWSMLTTSLFISVLECVSEQNDNLLLPLIAFSVIQLQGIK